MAAPRKPPPVPGEFALLYGFANSLDVRRFVEGGVPHTASDAFSTVAGLEAWLRRHGLVATGGRLDREDHVKALALRDAVRGFLELEPGDRRVGDRRIGERRAGAAALAAAAGDFPLIVQISGDGEVRLEPQPGAPLSGLGKILAELHHAAETGQIDRLKVCASDECRWVFFDRSKPATRRWCSSRLCGNRQKTRAYRQRRKGREGAGS
jgi:predicted RNA-binding Zn ribbon-like protein